MELDGISFFNSNTYLANRTVPEQQLFFFLTENIKKKNVAKFSLCTKANEALSQWKSPYGSIELETSLSIKNIDKLTDRITDWLRKNHFRSLKITSYPECYDLNQSVVFESFKKNKIKEKTNEINQFIEVSLSNFDTIISYAEKKRLNKCRRSGFTSELSHISELQEAYTMLVSSRKRKKYPVTMDFDSLNQRFLNHPDNYLLFTVKDNRRIIAMAVSIIVNKDILYNFYHADHEDYREFSPTVMVVDEIYKYCQRKKVRILDLGISSLNGVRNEGLYRFKKNLGAKECSKKIFEWSPIS